MRYGLLVADKSRNLGDTIQSLATQKLLPRVDTYLERDNLPELSEPTKVVFSGWFLHGSGPRRRAPYKWPPCEAIVPLFVSFHLSEFAQRRLLQDDSLDYFKRHGPIGCRDIESAKILKDHGVDAYFSGCITLTLTARKMKYTKRRGVWFVDVDRGASDKRLTHRTRMHGIAERFAAAQRLLDKYATARFVATSRLHCALPCLAFGTGFRFEPESWSDRRFTGLDKYLKNQQEPGWRELAAGIRQRVADFFLSEQS